MPFSFAPASGCRADTPKYATMEIIPIGTDHPYYAETERLLERAFPPEERRLQADQRRIAASDPRMEVDALVHGQRFIGLMTCWHLERILYVEHLATLPELRGTGLGTAALRLLLARATTPVVLEVELPTDEYARRRIEFYRRNEFVLWERQSYLQPPYRAGTDPLPMRLMVYGALDETRDFDWIRRTIHCAAYGCAEPLVGT